ncbi:DUF6458 family protein [Serinicoccus kebangsaanensis]|uniref:DUF6458 family protein n=1 Tax=Serinicoccus kebangsaanensis TaxID=2602069 RepID=UPI00124CB4D7|nr:DUF6458 family protein [Serinicoccus kebangsaanensis]
MGIGLGIFLLAVGAILSFAVGDLTSVVDLVTVGYILMAAGVLSLLLGLVMNTQRSNTTHREIIERNARGDSRYRDRDGY